MEVGWWPASGGPRRRYLATKCLRAGGGNRVCGLYDRSNFILRSMPSRRISLQTPQQGHGCVAPEPRCGFTCQRPARSHVARPANTLQSKYSLLLVLSFSLARLKTCCVRRVDRQAYRMDPNALRFAGAQYQHAAAGGAFPQLGELLPVCHNAPRSPPLAPPARRRMRGREPDPRARQQGHQPGRTTTAVAMWLACHAPDHEGHAHNHTGRLLHPRGGRDPDP